MHTGERMGWECECDVLKKERLIDSRTDRVSTKH